MKKETTLVKGWKFNAAMKKLANPNLDRFDIKDVLECSDVYITHFFESIGIPKFVINNGYAINVALEGLIPFYIWIEDTKIRYYTEADVVYLNEDSSYMFSNLSSIIDLDLRRFNSILVRDMSYMFSDCKRLIKLDIFDFRTLNVTNMSHMFNECESLVGLCLSRFNTVEVNNMACMFYNCKQLSYLDLHSFDLYNTSEMTSMLTRCESLKVLVLKGKKEFNRIWKHREDNGLKNLGCEIIGL